MPTTTTMLALPVLWSSEQRNGPLKSASQSHEESSHLNSLYKGLNNKQSSADAIPNIFSVSQFCNTALFSIVATNITRINALGSSTCTAVAGRESGMFFDLDK